MSFTDKEIVDSLFKTKINDWSQEQKEYFVKFFGWELKKGIIPFDIDENTIYPESLEEFIKGHLDVSWWWINTEEEESWRSEDFEELFQYCIDYSFLSGELNYETDMLVPGSPLMRDLLRSADELLEQKEKEAGV